MQLSNDGFGKHPADGVVVECPGLNGGGMFRRAFAFRMEVIEKKVDDKFVEGMLRITLPKAEKLAPKRIEIRV